MGGCYLVQHSPVSSLLPTSPIHTFNITSKRLGKYPEPLEHSLLGIQKQFFVCDWLLYWLLFLLFPVSTALATQEYIPFPGCRTLSCDLVWPIEMVTCYFELVKVKELEQILFLSSTWAIVPETCPSEPTSRWKDMEQNWVTPLLQTRPA